MQQRPETDKRKRQRMSQPMLEPDAVLVSHSRAEIKYLLLVFVYNQLLVFVTRVS